MECDIRIKSPTYPIGSDLVIKHSSDDTILQLKTKIKALLRNDSMAEAHQKLIYAGHVLEDLKTLAQLNIPMSATFHLVTSPEVRPGEAQAEKAAVALDESEKRNQDVHDATELAQPASSNADQDVMTPSMTLPASVASSEPARLQNSSLGTSGDTDTDIGNDPVANSSSPSVDVQQILGQCTTVQRTNINYELYYMDGYPYLVKAADRPPRSSRRPRHSATTTGATRIGTTSAIVRQTTMSTSPSIPPTTRHHQVDLPTTAAMPVRTADGRRALILSPEGVRAMAAQGVNVESNIPRRHGNLFGISPAAFQQLVRAVMPQVWLIAKLAFFVMMLGSNGTWSRFFVLNCIAIAIYLWQSGMAAAVIGLRGPAAAPVAAAAPTAPGNTQRSDEARIALDPATEAGIPQNSQIQQSPLLHDLGRAFLSSIVPSFTPPAAPQRPAAPADARPASDTNAPEQTDSGPQDPDRDMQTTATRSVELDAVGSSDKDEAVPHANESNPTLSEEETTSEDEPNENLLGRSVPSASASHDSS